jgi:hypothetical protein
MSASLSTVQISPAPQAYVSVSFYLGDIKIQINLKNNYPLPVLLAEDFWKLFLSMKILSSISCNSHPLIKVLQ